MAKKMTKKEQDEYRALLLEKRQMLTGNVSNLQKDVDGSTAGGRAAASGDSADMGSDTFELDFALSLMENEGEALQRIDEALKRLDDGLFGDCLECGRRIVKARLRAIPWSAYCIDCQRKAEAS